jgi:predicted transcriptional regulator
MLGGLEQKIMETLWASVEPLKPAQVLEKLSGTYAYTTVMTVLKRMSDKKLITRKPKGNAFLYSPITDKDTFAAQCLDDLFARLFDSYGEHTVVSFKKTAKKVGISL